MIGRHWESSQVQSGWMSGWHWLLFYGLVLAAWAGLFALTLPVPEWRNLGLYGWDLLTALCQVDPSEAGFLPLLWMWLLMSAAMMLPTFVSTLTVYEDLRIAGAGSRAGFAALIVGYLAVWSVYSVAAAGLQLALVPLQGDGEIDSRISGAVFLACVGLYQFSPLKAACLSRCRNPLAVFMANWNDSRFRELWTGIRFGAVCLGCCWLLMGFALVGGMAGLVWMGLATLVMAVEKLPSAGRFVSTPLGILALFGAVVSGLAI
ncbi:MAG: DUF2182 domain-containing protein [Rhodobacteraceae bacterium]|nr:DUF2182 domain-containing protein [Paracoccaceae bacterium]